MAMLHFVSARPAAWRARLLLGGLLVILVFGACSTADFTAENTSSYAPLTVRYTVRKTTNLFIFTSYDTLATDVVYQKRPILPANLCRPDSVSPRTTLIRAVPGYRGRWLLRVRCWPDDGVYLATYLLRLTPGGLRLQRIGTDNSDFAGEAEFTYLGSNRAVWVPANDTVATLFDLQELRGFRVQFPMLPDSVLSEYSNSSLGYYLAPDHRTVARLFSPDTTTQLVLRDSITQRTAAPAPAIYLDEYNAATHQLHRRRLPGQLLSAENPFQNTRWQPDAQGRWHLQLVL